MLHLLLSRRCSLDASLEIGTKVGNFRIYELPDGLLHIRVIRQRVRRRGTTRVHGVVDWRGELGQCSIHGFDPENGRFDDLKAAWDTMRQIAGVRSARKKSPRDQSLHRLAQGAANYRGRTGRFPTEKQLSLELGFSLDGIKSMKKQRGGIKIDKAEIETLALTLTPVSGS
jgi:hypothetical protein